MASPFINGIAALALLGAAAPLAARVEPVSATVSIADLDLASAAGLAALERRFVAAIRRACGTAEAKSRAAIRAVEQCRASLDAKASLAIAEIAAQPERLAQARQITLHG